MAYSGNCPTSLWHFSWQCGQRKGHRGWQVERIIHAGPVQATVSLTLEYGHRRHATATLRHLRRALANRRQRPHSCRSGASHSGTHSIRAPVRRQRRRSTVTASESAYRRDRCTENHSQPGAFICPAGASPKYTTVALYVGAKPFESMPRWGIEMKHDLKITEQNPFKSIV